MSYNLFQFVTEHWFIVLLGLIPFVYWYSTRNFNYWNKHGIPGPPNLPFWGSAFSFSTPIPLLYSGYVQKYGKYFGVFQGQTPQLVIADPELIKRIWVKDFHLFRNRPDLPPTNRIFDQHLVNAKDNNWKRIRSMLSPMFTSLKLRKMETLMLSCVDSMINWFDSMARDGKTFEARDPMSNFTMDVIARCAFATKTNAHKEKDSPLLENARKSFDFRFHQVLAIVLLPRWLRQWLIDHRVKPFHRETTDYFTQLTRHLITERKAPGAKGRFNDMLQLMVNAEHNPDQIKKTFTEDLAKEADGHHVNAGAEELQKEAQELQDIIGSKFLSEEEIMAQSFVFLLAGYETTASTLSYCLHELTVNPAIQERLYQVLQEAKLKDSELNQDTLAAIPYLDAVISETLRKYPPPQLLSRVATERYYILELKLHLEKGQTVLIPIYAIHHSEQYFPAPELFNPDRFLLENRDKIVPYSYLPFGGGPRNCIGMRFALTEAKLGLARIVDKFRLVKVEGTTEQLTILPRQSLLKSFESKRRRLISA